jgi:hypothetical protein
VAAVEAAKAATTAAAAEAAALLPSRELETPSGPAERLAPEETASRPTPTADDPTVSEPEEGRSSPEPPIESAHSTSEIRNQSPGSGDTGSQSGASTEVVESGAGREKRSGELGRSSSPHAQKRAAREGVDCAVARMRLLSTGEQMYAPVTQEGPILTEDLIKETEELVLKTGR